MEYNYPSSFETDRLLTRFLVKDDYKAWSDFLSDNESIRYLPESRFNSAEEWAKFWVNKQINRYKEKTYGLHALIEKKTGILIGQCGLLLQDVDGIKEVEVGYHIIHNYRGKGFATEAAKAFKTFALDKQQCDSVISIIHTDNITSQSVAKKNGMQIEQETKWMGLPVYIFR